MSMQSEWRWYFGSDENDGEMVQCTSRDDAIRQGREAVVNEQFYIVEAKMSAKHLLQIASNQRETAPFSATRNGEWIEPSPKSGGGA